MLHVKCPFKVDPVKHHIYIQFVKLVFTGVCIYIFSYFFLKHKLLVRLWTI